jgi:cytochrome c biogenesis protein CcmG/thiol:disulfide interchange protein DsbE
MAVVRRSLVAPVVGLLVVVSGCSLTSPGGGGSLQLTGPASGPPAEPLVEVDRPSFESVLVGFGGRGIVVNVWASWCGPCQVEAPLLQLAHKAHGAAVAFIGVDSRDERRPAAAFLDRYGITYLNVADPSGTVAGWLGSRGLPTTVIFDGAGRRNAIITGALTEQVLAGHLAELRR